MTERDQPAKKGIDIARAERLRRAATEASISGEGTGYIRTDRELVKGIFGQSVASGGLSFGTGFESVSARLLGRVVDLAATYGSMYLGPIRYEKLGGYGLREEELRSQIINPAYHLNATLLPDPHDANKHITIEAQGYADPSQMPADLRHKRAIWNWPKLVIGFGQEISYANTSRPSSYNFEFARDGVSVFKRYSYSVGQFSSGCDTEYLEAAEALEFLEDNLPEITGYKYNWHSKRVLTNTTGKVVSAMGLGGDVELAQAWLQNTEQGGYGGVLFVPPATFSRSVRPGFFFSGNRPEADIANGVLDNPKLSDRVESIIDGLDQRPDEVGIANTFLLLRSLPGGSDFVTVVKNLKDIIAMPFEVKVPTIFSDRAAEWFLTHIDVTNAVVDDFREMHEAITGRPLEDFYNPDQDYWPSYRTAIANAIMVGSSNADKVKQRKFFEELIDRDRVTVRRTDVDMKSDDNQRLIDQSFNSLAGLGARIRRAGVYDRRSRIYGGSRNTLSLPDSETDRDGPTRFDELLRNMVDAREPSQPEQEEKR